MTPWPVTSKVLIVDSAVKTARLLAQLSGDPSLAFSRAELGALLELDTRFFCRGYGYATRSGLAAMELWQRHTSLRLDTTYSAKSAAAVVDRLRRGLRGPLLYWATKSSADLPAPCNGQRSDAPARVQRWLAEAVELPADRAASSWWSGAA